ncbi:ABC transporter permease [Oceanirhabdus sp. W0125-5]|uniref:ABC transporter permease n=1 Tax=Oceanirhabdus sp. W0125-5 TaxID=2999116 RepID=UPI0022F30D7D|nr:ABC-2 family transporter protein [Oceanirhabdus sp. W0125-5]WBW98399.1 ABC-2 family transporter protein [Oceanirhabdus sp. W0125-5]
MRRYWKLYKRFISQYLKILMQSKTNFFMGFLGFFSVQMSGIAFLYLVFENIPNLNGWSFYEILFIYGFAQLPRGVDHLLTDYLWVFSRNTIVTGDFDRYILRPINPLFQVIAERLQLDAVGELVTGVLIMGIAYNKLNMSLTLIEIVLLIIVIIAGAIIYTSIKLFIASLAFWMKQTMHLLFMVYSFSDFAKYPNNIYSKAIQGVITFIIPFAFTAFIPASYFLNKSSIYLGIFGTVGVAIATFVIAYSTWCIGVKNYESAGN